MKPKLSLWSQLKLSKREQDIASLTGEAVGGGSFLSGGEWNLTKASPYAMFYQTQDRFILLFIWLQATDTRVCNSQAPYLAVRLAAHYFHPVPLLLCCALLHLARPEETHAVHVGAIAALRWRHEGRRNQENLEQRLKVKNTWIIWSCYWWSLEMKRLKWFDQCEYLIVLSGGRRVPD